MAKNGPKGGGRKGAVKGRSQFKIPMLQKFAKRNTKTGKVMDVKADKKPFKGIRREK